ncbi:hypothetical protein FQZ97_1016370 [compost metagenome]
MNSALPMVQCRASVLGCERPARRMAEYANIAMPTSAAGSSALKMPPMGNQYDGTPTQ